jgi:hypothetical protein
MNLMSLRLQHTHQRLPSDLGTLIYQSTSCRPPCLCVNAITVNTQFAVQWPMPGREMQCRRLPRRPYPSPPSIASRSNRQMCDGLGRFVAVQPEGSKLFSEGLLGVSGALHGGCAAGRRVVGRPGSVQAVIGLPGTFSATAATAALHGDGLTSRLQNGQQGLPAVGGTELV